MSHIELNNTEIYLIDILNRMFVENTTQITYLNESNENILNSINNIIYRNNRQRHRNRNRNNNTTVSENLNNNESVESVSTNNTTDQRNATRQRNTTGQRNTSIQRNLTPAINYHIEYYTRPIADLEFNFVQDASNSLFPLFQDLYSNETRTNTLSGLFENFLDPITIYPTEAQIDAATRITRYGSIVNPLNLSCPISLEPFRENDFVTMIRSCGHIFNGPEINEWFRTNVRCPVCRFDIRNHRSNTSRRTYSESI